MIFPFRLLFSVAALSLPLGAVAGDGAPSAKDRADMVELLHKHDAAIAVGDADALAEVR